MPGDYNGARAPAGRILLLSLLVIVVSACGTTGTTNRFVVDLDLGKNVSFVSEVRVASAAVDANAAAFMAVGQTRPWGRFDVDDLANVEHSLRDTVAAHGPKAGGTLKSRLDIHFVVRRYAVAVSNTGGAVLAIVAWAVTSPDGKVIFQEQFYASGSLYLVGTIGGLKDSVNSDIVRRIARKSVSLAAEGLQPDSRSPQMDKTAATFEEAARRLPKTMVFMGDAGLMASSITALTIIGAAIPRDVKSIRWESVRSSNEFDWDGYLQRVYAQE